MRAPLADLDHLHRQFRGDGALVRQWMALYLEEAPMMVARVRQALEAGDGAGMAHAVHDLRPQAQYLAAPRMLAVLAAVAERARSGEVGACGALVEELEAVARQVEEELRKALAG